MYHTTYPMYHVPLKILWYSTLYTLDIQILFDLFLFVVMDLLIPIEGTGFDLDVA